MKVGTDSIVLGSWVQQQLKNHIVTQKPRILDIGCGSGLLSIMMAQIFSGQTDITAYDIDQKACEQARENVERCPWPNSTNVLHDDVTSLSFAAGMVDLVVCNPPYFEAAQRPTRAYSGLSKTRKAARHQESLTLEQLLQCIRQVLTGNGKAFVVLPTQQAERLKLLLPDYQLFCSAVLMVKPTPNKPESRQCLELTKQDTATTLSELNVYDENNVYSNAFREMCRAFYLKF